MKCAVNYIRGLATQKMYILSLYLHVTYILEVFVEYTVITFY